MKNLITKTNLFFTRNKTDCGCNSKSISLSNFIENTKYLQKPHKHTRKHVKSYRKNTKSKHNIRKYP